VAAPPNNYDQERRLLLQQFGKAIRQVREKRALSQEELGRRCGLHRTEISLLERGLRAPRLCTLLLIAAELGVPTAELIDGLPIPRARRQGKDVQ
jgi:transcriptional regulator with XRE-family HTH domain